MKENSKVSVEAGNVYKSEGGLYRIICVNAQFIIMIQMETQKYNIQRIPLDYFANMVMKQEVVKVDYAETEFFPNKISEEEMKKVREKQACIEELLRGLYPNWELLQSRKTKPVVLEFLDKLDVKEKAGRKMIRRYLQAGRNHVALIDNRKSVTHKKTAEEGATMGIDSVRGPNTKSGVRSQVKNNEELFANFQEAYNDFCKHAEQGASLNAAYERMLLRHYSTKVQENSAVVTILLPKEERPSKRRFLYYCKKRMGTQTVNELKKGAMSTRNNNRLLMGNSQSGCSGPGSILEIDEVELDIMLVASEDNRQIVGRGIMYVAVDVYSCCIVSCWVDFDNNSYLGVTNLLLELIHDHNEETSKYGITIPEGIYPSRFIPDKIRVDQGSEYISKELRRLHQEMEIDISIVAPGTGSLKGLVEQSFHQFQELLRTEAIDAGTILKRHDSNHYDTACMDIFSLRCIAYNFVVYYNQHIRKNYPLTKDMIESKVVPAPAFIWKYGIENVSAPRAITASLHEMMLFALMKTDRVFKVSRSGITHKGLYYFTNESWLIKWMYEAGNKTVKISEVRYDPRDVSQIYIMQDSKIHAIPLNFVRDEMKSFVGITWKRYDDLMAQKKRTADEYEDQDLTARLTMREVTQDTVESAKRMRDKGKNKKKDIREARAEEREESAQNNRISDRLKKDVSRESESALSEYEGNDTIEENAPKESEILSVIEDDDFSEFDKFFER